MTLIGKIFTVLIFFMSIVFMSFSVMVFATHKNWKEAALATEPSRATGQIGLKQQLQAQYEVNNALRNELEGTRMQLAEHQAARRAALAELQSQARFLQTTLDGAQSELATKTAAHTAVVQALEVAEANLDKVINDNSGLRTDIVTIQKDRDEKLARVVSLADTVNQAETKLTQLQERRDQLVAQVAFQKMTLEQHNIDLSGPLPTSLERRVDGIVTAVSERNLVEVSIGLDDGVREGHTLEVFRDNKYLGKVTVTKVTANRSVAQIDPRFLQAPIRKGDRVASKIS